MKLARMARSSMRDIETLCCLVEGHRIVALALPFFDLFSLMLPQLKSPCLLRQAPVHRLISCSFLEKLELLPPNFIFENLLD